MVSPQYGKARGDGVDEIYFTNRNHLRRCYHLQVQNATRATFFNGIDHQKANDSHLIPKLGIGYHRISVPTAHHGCLIYLALLMRVLVKSLNDGFSLESIISLPMFYWLIVALDPLVRAKV